VKSDHRHRLLRACRERPRGRRAANKLDELAPLTSASDCWVKDGLPIILGNVDTPAAPAGSTAPAGGFRAH
jgi:hypothetical protein